MKINTNYKCPECGSIHAITIMRILDGGYKETLRVCKKGCPRDLEKIYGEK